jgi:hypothetical protein
VTVTVGSRSWLPLTHPSGNTDGDGNSAEATSVTVLRLDATIIESATMKPGVAGHYKGGIGYHPLIAWCTNIGDHLVVMQLTRRPGDTTITKGTAIAGVEPAATRHDEWQASERRIHSKTP